MFQFYRLQLITLVYIIFSSPCKAEVPILTLGTAIGTAERIDVTWKGQVNPTVGIRPERFDARAQGTSVSIGCPSRCAAHVPNLARVFRSARLTTSLCGAFVFAKISLWQNGVPAVGVVSEEGRCLSFQGQNYIMSEEFANIVRNRPTKDW